MRYRLLQRLLPTALRDFILHFEAHIEKAVASMAASLPSGANVLDAGAGECRHAAYFTHQRYTAVDLAVGDAAWNYTRLDAVADLAALPFAPHSFDAALNIVTLEHVQEPLRVLQEIYRVLRPGGRLLLVVPHEWEEHQQPHDYFRYTRYGVMHLLRTSGYSRFSVEPVGGYFRLLARRLLNGMQFFPGIWKLPAALVLAPPALLLPLLEPLDRQRHFTLGFICVAEK